jgi:hypothetical protein
MTASDRHMRCDEKERLLRLYQAKLSARSAAISDLTVTRGKTSQLEYDRLLAAAQKARVDSEASSRAFYEHIVEHGC